MYLLCLNYNLNIYFYSFHLKSITIVKKFTLLLPAQCLPNIPPTQTTQNQPQNNKILCFIQFSYRCLFALIFEFSKNKPLSEREGKE